MASVRGELGDSHPHHGGRHVEFTWVGENSAQTEHKHGTIEWKMMAANSNFLKKMPSVFVLL